MTKEQLEEMLKIMRDVENFIFSIERKGIPYREFLGAKDENGRLPRFQMKLADHFQFVYSEEEFAEIRKTDEEVQRQKHAERMASIPMEEQTEEMKTFRAKGLPFVELYEESQLDDLKQRLSNYNFALDQYNIADGKLFDIVEEEGRDIPVHTLKEGID